MNESDLIQRTHASMGKPVTTSSLIHDFHKLGLREGDVLLVHCSLSSFGWVCGGAQAVLEAFFRVLGSEGTLVMPTQSAYLSDPGEWRDPPVPDSWKSVIRREMPAFDPYLSPTRDMGIVAELFRLQPGVLRSGHPSVSFAARGPSAEFLMKNHPLDDGLGEEGPLARLYEYDARILLIGCGYEKNTSLHLAENRAEWPGKGFHSGKSPVLEGKERLWKSYREFNFGGDDFPACGFAFENAVFEGRFPAADNRPMCLKGKAGLADCRFLSQRSLIDFAAAWFEENRADVNRKTGCGKSDSSASGNGGTR